MSRGAMELPAITSDGTGYLIVTSSWGDVYAQTIDATGVPTGPDIDVNHLVSNAVGSQTNPVAAYVGSAYTVAFLDTRWRQPGIYAQRIDTSGDAFGTETNHNTPIYVGARAVDNLAIASTGASGLLIWQTNGDLLGMGITP
jgi:hypothetical protein